MNPLDWRGPEFLLFYTFLALVVIATVIVRRVRRDPSGPTRGRLTHPYRIAYLRGGAAEALRVVALSLLDRGLLRAEGESLVAVPGAAAPADDRLEQAVLERFASLRPTRQLFEHTLTSLADEYRGPLEALGLLPDPDLRRASWRDAMVAAALLVVVATCKVFVAFARGHTNVIFLVLIAVLAVYLVAKLSRPRLTGRGRELVRSLGVLFQEQRRRTAALRAGVPGDDSRMVAAVYGVGVLALMPAFAHAKLLFPSATWMSFAQRGSDPGSATWTMASCGGGGGDGGGGGGGDGGGGCGGCGGD